MMTLLLLGTGCASSKVVGDAYTDENGYYCLSPETLKTINIAIKNSPDKKIIVVP